LICKSHKATEGTCPSGQIFTPASGKCVSINSVNPKNFCDSRPQGNYRNPWNCHNYFTCAGGRTFDRLCSTLTTLNYAPTDDICEYPNIHKCVNITDKIEATSIQVPAFDLTRAEPINRVVETADNPCKDKADGKYAIRDVFKFLKCRRGKATIKDCRSGRYYSPSANRCIGGKKVDTTTFCKGRDFSNYRNPWDCHNFITCHGTQDFDRPCDTHVTLNYDPSTDRCEDPKICPCKQLDGGKMLDKATAEVIEAEMVVF